MARGKKMSKASDGRSGDAPETCRTGGTNENKPKMNGDLCQLKIDSFVSPIKSSCARPPLQEENSTLHHEGKALGKTSSDVHRKTEESGPNQKPTGTDTQKKLPPADRNAEPQKVGKTKRHRRKVQGTKSPNRKVTDYFPVRRSCRKCKKDLESEEKQRIDELIKSGKEEGLKVDMTPGKGRGVIATRNFLRGEFVVEYHGDLLEITAAKEREVSYAEESSVGCYMYYFQFLNKTYCVDATKESKRLGRLINHSKAGNCHTKLHSINDVPHLILIASRDIEAGEELLYDYGDRSKSSIEAHPWLKH
ncbi:N-lysine methyltransferase KMT5A [Pseudophryne corroboree]|uniref:N-lysine methyltransferase KMT5A n=1 Tax=Pseudophryne corroboree TaxID=495146 RepID=UPI003081770A